MLFNTIKYQIFGGGVTDVSYTNVKTYWAVVAYTGLEFNAGIRPVRDETSSPATRTEVTLAANP